jgi:hypothetical protein
VLTTIKKIVGNEKHLQEGPPLNKRMYRNLIDKKSHHIEGQLPSGNLQGRIAPQSGAQGRRERRGKRRPVWVGGAPVPLSGTGAQTNKRAKR